MLLILLLGMAVGLFAGRCPNVGMKGRFSSGHQMALGNEKAPQKGLSKTEASQTSRHGLDADFIFFSQLFHRFIVMQIVQPEFSQITL